MKTLMAFVAAVGLAACAEQYEYTPEGATVDRNGEAVQITKVPPEAPRGTVEVSSRGVKTVHLSDGRTIRALDVRMIVDNEGDATPWTVDVQNQLVEIAGVGRTAPIFVNGDPTSALPVMQVGERQRHTLDFYFPLPPQRTNEKSLPAFDFLWEVNTPTGTSAGRSKFQRIEPYYYYPDVFIGAWGPYWWYDPFWPSVGYVRGYPYHYYYGHRAEHPY